MISTTGPNEIKSLIEAEKPAAVVVMLGSNDRQQMRVGDVREQPRSENWTKEYERRTDAFGKAIASAKVPFLWVGMPAFRVPKMTSDMLAFNDIYHSAAESNGGEFVDVWDGFVDENGAFVTSGPDINGQPVRLRADDGINVSKAGKRKLAFYTEKPLTKILGLTSARRRRHCLCAGWRPRRGAGAGGCAHHRQPHRADAAQRSGARRRLGASRRWRRPDKSGCEFAWRKARHRGQGARCFAGPCRRFLLAAQDRSPRRQRPARRRRSIRRFATPES